jgi:hypothetical protein
MTRYKPCMNFSYFCPVKNKFLRRYNLFFCILLISLWQPLHTQAQADSSLSVPKALPRFGNYHDFEQGMSSLKKLDTTINQVQKFDPGYLHNLGTPGSPVFPLIWDPFKTPGFDLGFHQFDAYRLTNENLKMYNTQNPYAELFYVQGAQDIQSFRATYSQNIKPYWNFSFLLDGLNTNKGYYEAQGTQLTKTAANTWYRSPNGHYMAMASVIFNNFQAQENGAIASDSLFLNSTAANRIGLPVNFGAYSLPISAKQAYIENFVSARQYYRFGRVENVKVRDTDSVATRILHPEFFISHTFDYHDNKYTYNDAFTGLPFTHAYLDPIKTEGKYESEEFSNKIAIGRAEFNHPVKVKNKVDSGTLNKEPLFFQVYGKYAIIKAFQQSGKFDEKDNYNNTSVGFEVEKNGRFGLTASGEYFLSGFNQYDYLLNADLRLPFIKKILPQFNVNLKSQQITQSYTDELFDGNHFLWQNWFKSSNFNSATAWFSDTLGFKLGGAYQTAMNLVYYDTTAYPVQDPGTVTYARVFLSKEFRFWRFNFLNNINYQKVLSHSYDVRVPDWLFRMSWFYQDYFFKKALFFQGGFDFSYSSAYKGYAYMPEISRFYVQDKINIGNYQVWDVWIAGKVKRFVGFVKIEHVNQGFSGNWYFVAPHYPLYPVVYRVGVRWTFYN